MPSAFTFGLTRTDVENALNAATLLALFDDGNGLVNVAALTATIVRGEQEMASWLVGAFGLPLPADLSADPFFADAAHGDYHEKSKAGRWNGSAWVKDLSNSECIDGGDPASECSLEPAPNGGRLNMGAYGNTSVASKSAPPGTLFFVH